MENYRNQDSLGRRCGTGLEERLPYGSLTTLNAELLYAVMPLHQIIRYANHASRNRTPVYICVEEEVSPHRYQRKVLKGVFRSPVTNNRQIMFLPINKDILYLLSIDDILSVQKAEHKDKKMG